MCACARWNWLKSCLQQSAGVHRAVMRKRDTRSKRRSPGLIFFPIFLWNYEDYSHLFFFVLFFLSHLLYGNSLVFHTWLKAVKCPGRWGTVRWFSPVMHLLQYCTLHIMYLTFSIFCCSIFPLQLRKKMRLTIFTAVPLFFFSLSPET